VYRQISGQNRVTPWVLTHKRENAAQFPFPDKRLVVLPKPRLRWWRRLVHRHFIDAPWQIYRWELHTALLTLTRIDARLLHIYFGHMALHMRPLIRACPRPVVVSYHGADAGVDTNRPSHLAAMREVFRFAAQIQVRSESLGNDLIKLGCPEKKIHIQRTGIPLEEWPLTERVAPGEGEWHLMQSCRLIAKKGLDTTLKAFAKIKAQYPAAKLTLAGEGPLLEELKQLAESLHIAEAVDFPGFMQQEQLRALVQRSHIFLHPSRTGRDGNREGVPNSMLEAMASGCPVVATRHGGIPEAITHEQNGLLIDENDTDAMAGCMERLLADQDLRLQLARNARETIEVTFNRDRNIAILEDNYLRLIHANL